MKAHLLPEDPKFHDLSPTQKAVLDIAFIEGRILIAGTGLAPYIMVARLLCKKGLLEREEGTNHYRITEKGIYLRENAEQK